MQMQMMIQIVGHKAIEFVCTSKAGHPSIYIYVRRRHVIPSRGNIIILMKPLWTRTSIYLPLKGSTKGPKNQISLSTNP